MILRWIYRLMQFINRNQGYIFLFMVIYALLGFVFVEGTVYDFIYHVSLILCWLGCLLLYDSGPR